MILDGSDARVRFGAVFAGLHPDLPVWISGDCSGRPAVHQAFAAAGLAPGRVRYDLLATDTVTHFTVLAGDYVEREISSRLPGHVGLPYDPSQNDCGPGVW